MAPVQPAPLWHRPLDAVLVLFFVIHVPTALLCDVQCLLPENVKSHFPAVLREAVQYHVETNGDFLVGELPPWFFSLVVCEIFLQLPFFFVAIYAFCLRKEWIRIPALIYAVHTVTTMIPILMELALSKLPLYPDRVRLIGIYLPFFIMPLVLFFRVLGTPLFTSPARLGGKEE